MSMERTKKRRRSVRAASGENRGLATLRRMVVGGSEKISGQQSHAKRRENLGKSSSNATESYDPDCRSGKVSRWPANKLACRLLRKKKRDASGECQSKCEGMLSNLIGQHARRAGDDNIRIDNAWHEAVVEPGRRRLNPLESARSDNVVPRYRHLGMTTEQIGRKEIRGNRLLRGDRHESIACCGLNLLNMFGFNGITQDQSWRVHQNILSGIVAISKLLSVLCRQQTRTANLFTQGIHNENRPPHSTEKEGNKPFCTAAVDQTPREHVVAEIRSRHTMVAGETFGPN